MHCETCSDDINICTSCKSASSYKYLEEGKCKESCSDGYSLDNEICVPCATGLHCETCSEDINTCTSCKSSSSFKYLEDEKCKESCSNGIYNYIAYLKIIINF